jgi:hypothetical protein
MRPGLYAFAVAALNTPLVLAAEEPLASMFRSLNTYPKLAETYSVVDEVARRALYTGARVLGARSEELPDRAPLTAILRYDFGIIQS